MANQIVCVLEETYGLRIYPIMLPPTDFSVTIEINTGKEVIV